MTDHADNRRILLVDDNQAIHDDFRKILAPSSAAAEKGLSNARAAFLGGATSAADEEAKPAEQSAFEVDSALQGQDAYELLRVAVGSGRPYAMAFVDMRMPPGWDGVETIRRLWELDPQLQVVICTAFSDYSWEETVETLGVTDRLLILKKPFDTVEIRQLASALTEKWNVAARERSALEEVQRAEREVRAYATSLETVNRAMMTSRAVADRAAESRNDLLAHLSNEVRKHIDGIAEKVHLLSPPEGAGREYLEQFECFVDASTLLVRRLEEVLDMTNMESGRAVVELTPCSVAEVTRDVCERYRERAAAKGLDFEVELSESLPETVLGQPDRLAQVLDNLLDNAVRFTQAGGVSVRVSCDHADGPRRPRLAFEIADTGPGIPKERLGELFEPLERGEAFGGGSGFGLAIAQRVAFLLGGEIVARSEEGAGSSFTLRIDTEVPNRMAA